MQSQTQAPRNNHVVIILFLGHQLQNVKFRTNLSSPHWTPVGTHMSSSPGPYASQPENQILPDVPIGDAAAEFLHELVHHHHEDVNANNEGSDTEEAIYRHRLPWWKRPSPWW